MERSAKTRVCKVIQQQWDKWIALFMRYGLQNCIGRSENSMLTRNRVRVDAEKDQRLAFLGGEGVGGGQRRRGEGEAEGRKEEEEEGRGETGGGGEVYFSVSGLACPYRLQ